MDELTVPGQLDTIIEAVGILTGKVGTVTQRLEDGDRRMNEADTVRGLMNDQLSHHGLVLTDHGMKMDEQNVKLDTVIKAIAENTAMTNIVKDALTTARVGRQVLIWVASIVGAGGGIYAAIAPFLHR